MKKIYTCLNFDIHCHVSIKTGYYLFQVGERIRVILDCEDNTLAFEKNYEFLGKSLSKLQCLKWFKIDNSNNIQQQQQ